MSLATIFGLLSSIGLFIFSIAMSTNNWMVFVHMEGFLMVIGGTFGSAFIAYEPRYVLQSIKLMRTILLSPKIGRGALTGEVGRVIRWGYMLQKSGLPSLEADAGKIRGQDKFLSFGMDLVISGYTGQEVRDTLTNTIETTFQRGCVPAEILKTMGSNAPAFGLIACLVGLIVMFSNMASDPGQVGPGLSVGLTGTLYGVMAARLFFIPVASKLQQREEIVRFRNYLVAEGLALLAERKSPRYIQDRMNSFLDPSIHFSIDKHMKR
ncbi:MAG: MotA/TolQ/ExbB proton channel family protein [Rhodospirillales bacterium]|nr:MotA/TolQ/ExbB proton channel family protein [Rhodospirillales bacterium]